MSEPLLGDPDDLRKMLEAFEERNVLLEQQIRVAEAQSQTIEHLAGLVERLLPEVVALRAQVHDRPTAANAEHKRRVFTAFLILWTMVVIWGHDAHVENCGPSARAEAAVEELLKDGPTNEQAIADAVNGRDVSRLCDVSFPFHDHDGNVYPGPRNIAGWALYGGLGVGLLLWAQGPRPRKANRRSTDLPDDPEPDEGVPSAP